MRLSCGAELDYSQMQFYRQMTGAVSFRRVLGGTRSGASPPTACDTDTKQQTDSSKPADQKWNNGSMEIGHSDWGGYRKSDTPTQQCSQTISHRKPPHLGTDQNSRTDADHSSDECSAEQSGLPCSVAQDGSDHSPESRKDPPSDE